MIKRVSTITAIGAALWLSAATFAQRAQVKQPQKPGAASEQMSMADMMKNCREHCQATSASVDKTLATIKEARQSNDPAEMRAALDQIEKPLTDMTDHMGMCVKMMDMMKMHSK
jgi:hypothetical protein